MATAYSDLSPGTPLVWTSSGGDFVLTGTSLADGSARQGAKNSATLIDATKGMPEVLEVVFETKVQAAPTDGKEVELWLGWSNSLTAATNNPGGLTGADAALSSPASVKNQLSFAGSIILSNAVGTGVQRQDPFLVRPKDIALIPVVVNASGQTISATGTDTKVTITPYYRRAPVA
jgi:hypothetical protein